MSLEELEFGPDASLPSGYALYRTETRTLTILLPIALKDELHQEKSRRDALQLEAELRAANLRRAEEATSQLDRPTYPRPTSPTTSVFANPGNGPSIIDAFERGVSRRNRSRSHPVLEGKELLRVAARILTMRDKDYQKRELEVLEKLRSKGALRKVGNPGFAHARWAESLLHLRNAHPHFAMVTDFVAAQVALSLRSKRPLTVPPIHLCGVPGVGKTHYANDLAEALGVPIRKQSMENAQTTALLLGTERHWSSATFGIVFDQIVLGEVANPLFLIDELDKATRHGTYDPLAALHSLLEPLTSKSARDAAMDISFDASLAIYVATSNNPDRIPQSLRSRFREFEISPPTGEQALRAARVVVNHAAQRLGVKGFSAPDARIAYQLAHLTAREIHHAIQDAAARAIEAGRMHLTLADLPSDVVGEDGPRRLVH